MGEPASAPQRPWLLVNPRSGDGRAAEVGLVERARARGIEVVVLGEEDDLGHLARDAVAAGADALGMSGGDGSLSVVAQVAIEHALPFVCVPGGTRNHFARDLGLDRSDPIAALDAFAGEQRHIDVGRVGERLFLNNVTLGVYAEIIHRPGYRENKLGVASEVVPEMLNGSRPPARVSFADPTGRGWDAAFMLLVANNPYDLVDIVEFGARPRLDRGRLAVTVIDATAPTELAGAAASVLLGRIERSSCLHQWTCEEIEIASPESELLVGLDGEALRLAPPLRCRVEPGALSVLVPPGTRGPRGRRRKVFGRRTLRDLAEVARGRS